MKKRLPILPSLFAIVLASGALALENEPYPLEYWALRSVINNAQVSPDGKYLGIMKIPSKDGNPIVEIYDAADLTKEPFRFAAEPMELTNFYWASNENIIFTARQKVRDTIEGWNQGVYETRIGAVNVKKQKLRTFDESGASIEELLPNKPRKVILSFFEGGSDGPGSKIAEAFRPRSYWEFDLEKGTKRLLIRGKLSLGNIDFDPEGNPLIARGFDLASGEFITYYRPEGTTKWVEAVRTSEESFETFAIAGPDPAKPGNALAYANNGDDKIGLWSYNMENKSFDELIYRRNDVDVYSIRSHSNPWEHPMEPVAVMYYKDKMHYEYFDEVEGAVYNQLEQIIPNAFQISIPSRSRDGNTMTILNTGPKDPGTYYLLKDGKIESVGSRQPLLESEKLADIEYIVYEARDGATIPAFITIPNSKPPYPLVVMPHGGPFVTETVIYDEWAQMLANNGYMVLQPQFRGSTNYGQNFYQSAFRDGGQGGYKMQDDKDDGAMYLVEQGLADPDRMAMFGWSYGGYAALVAASRTPQLYQCVIAGAAVTDPNYQINFYRFNMRGAQREEQLAMWDESISPIEEVAKVNVPMLVIHGDVDQRVPPKHAEMYEKELIKHNKNYKMLWLDGADHFSNTLFFHHQIELYTNIIDFLKNDCGPGGLQAAVN